MKVRAVWWVVALLIGFMGLAPCLAQEVNILTNGGFETGTTAPWGGWSNTNITSWDVVTQCAGAAVPEGPIEGKYCLHVKVTGAGADWWTGGVTYNPGTFQKGKKYTLSMYLKGKVGGERVNFKPEHSADPWEGYGEQIQTMTDKWAEYSITTPVFAADVSPASLTLHTEFAAQEFWIDAARWYEGDYVEPAFLKNFAAKSPSPEKDATDIPRDAALSWQAGPFAKTHNVFIGDTFDDVNSATVATSAGLTETTFDPPGLLVYGKTYYWRVDEVNGTPDKTVYPGSIWSFTVEPYAYPVTGVTVTASSAFTNGGNTAAKTIDGSGLGASGEHSNVAADGWLTAPTSKLPAWIRYDLGGPYTIQQMKVWNSNQTIEQIVGFGAKTVLIEYSLDGTTTWTTLNTVEFAQADGMGTYAGFTVDMGSVQARYVRLTIQSNWSLYAQQTGLSEVRFLYIPVQAAQPSPANDAEGVPVDAGFDWREGRKAASHKVYFSTDKAAVASGAALVDTTTASFYQPPSLDFGSFYYWRVDEVNSAPAGEWPGSVWAFTTAEYAAIDDFESYTNDSPNRVFQAWIDGWGFSPDDSFPNGSQGNGSGALVGYDPSLGNIMETSITHGGVQSMPVEYNNVNSPYYSEIERSWTSAQNWTTNGATELALWFHGSPAALVETATGVTLSGAGADIYMGTSEFRFAYKKLSGDGSITVRVDSAQTQSDWTKAGLMIRESLDPLAIQVHMISAPRQSLLEWMYRSATNSTTTTAFNTAANSNPLPVWLRLTRAGNVFTGECSTDGKTWTKITGTDVTSSATITMPASVYIGMVVCSQSAGNLAVADFSQIKTSGNVTGNWLAADIGVAQPANKPDQLYVVVQDSANKSVTVKHPDGANAVLANQWTQWRIPLSQLTGVNTKAIKKMTIGIGDRSAPKAGAAGHLFIDDIQYGRPILPVGLVAQYSMENNADDSSGNGHNGTIVGSPTFVNGPAGKGKAIQFSGAAGQYIDLGTFNPSAMTGRLSVALWAQWKGPTGLYQGLIAKRNYWSTTDMMWQMEANNAAGNVTFSRNGSYPASGNPILPVGEWAHVAVTFDKTTAKFYVNGAMTGQGAFSFGPNREASMHIGCCDVNGSNPFNGAIDEVRLYDTALTDAEVRALAGK